MVKAAAMALILASAASWSRPALTQTILPTYATPMVKIPAGTYVPFFGRPGKSSKRSVAVASFWLDAYPATNGQYLDFVQSHPEWQKSQAKPIFMDSQYLEGWPDDLSWGPEDLKNQPVTNVSWFAANAYCHTLGKSLPTTDQWEYALADGGRGKDSINDKVLQWYGTPNSTKIPPVEQSDKNGYGIYGLVGLVWEWTLDYNNVMSGAELRQSGTDKNLVCGGAGLLASDPSDYASFMRFSLRSSLKATYTTANLGFRCAKDKP
jgi:formylglycine-generating enzyme